ncbi:hypothetical protein PAV_6c04670 [Paenibacillus alvei DSM 29]|nr:hypothetical protein PAV_6c04670 [Paenibacillus alvei DSM 29]
MRRRAEKFSFVRLTIKHFSGTPSLIFDTKKVFEFQVGDISIGNDSGMEDAVDEMRISLWKKGMSILPPIPLLIYIIY